jgi:hypothetical protein
MATTKITNPELFDLGSLDTALKLPSGTTAERPTSPSTGEWRYNTDNNLVEFWDGGAWKDLQDEDIPTVPSENFNVVLYSGNGSTQSITGVGFKPDWVWIKERSAAESHRLFDSTRGATKRLFSDNTNAESTATDSLTSFDTDGFSLGSSAGINESGQTYVAWCWKANGGTTSSNTDGTITSTVQANTKAGFSVISYTGNGSSGATIGHGLSVAPEFLIFKRLNAVESWNVWSSSLSSKVGFLNLGDAFINYSVLGAGASTITLNNGTGHNASGSPYVCYAFAPSTGYSKFGSYTGNGSTNGPIVETGFEPAFLMIKRTDSGDNWLIFDNKRNPSNPRNLALIPNSSQAELTGNLGNGFNFLSNGFQVVSSDTGVNASGGTYLYIAFGSDQSAAPVLADSFANKLYTGNSSTQSITGLGFSPSLSWIKVRNNSYVPGLYDILRGPLQRLRSNGTEANENVPNSLFSFDSDGFTLGSDIGQNQTAMNYVAWNWKANAIPTINTEGTIQSVVSANQASGFSIVKYTGTGSAGTVGHGLSSKCDMVIIKTLDSINNWIVQLPQLGDNARMLLDSTSAKSDDATTAQAGNATVFGIGADNSVAKNGDNFIAYCFTSISGFSKVGSYTGNGSATGPTVTTGFQPNWIMIKRTDAGGTNWNIMDSARGNSDYLLAANTNAAEVTNETPLNTTSTGFEITESSDYINASGGTYIYMAFKENPTPMPLAGNMSFLVIAGGGSGGARDAGPGGAGGLRTSYGSTSGGGSSAESDITLAAGTYTITIGAGGAKVVEVTAITPGNQGVDSSLSGTGMTTVTSLGGGKGGDGAGTSPGTGGSGGGGTASQSGGSGTSGQGFAGATGTGGYTSGGGGGAGATGNTPPSNENGGAGGAGLSVSITGSSTAYAGGGGGSGDTSGGAGGTGGGGAGQSNASLDATSGTANTGGGGGSHRQNLGTSGAGGSGVVVLRLLTSEYSSSTTGSPTVTTDGDYTVLTYTGSGTYVHS